ncbi:hypothetical protein LCGC14_1727760 [marine sediment metagenome]|uniref:Uncharacterized protein n=1 Tax=marine sediment metagenome TaxID=412755 RepID=A0A0F9JR08_9ZZZZ
MPSGVVATNQSSEPKEFNIPSRSYGITAVNAADTLVEAQEIRNNKPLFAAAVKIISKQLVAQRQAQLAATKAAGKKT